MEVVAFEDEGAVAARGEEGATGEVGEEDWCWWVAAELLLWELMLWGRGRVKGTRKGTFATMYMRAVC